MGFSCHKCLDFDVYYLEDIFVIHGPICPVSIYPGEVINADLVLAGFHSDFKRSGQRQSPAVLAITHDNAYLL